MAVQLKNAYHILLLYIASSQLSVTRRQLEHTQCVASVDNAYRYDSRLSSVPYPSAIRERNFPEQLSISEAYHVITIITVLTVAQH